MALSGFFSALRQHFSQGAAHLFKRGKNFLDPKILDSSEPNQTNRGLDLQRLKFTETDRYSHGPRLILSGRHRITTPAGGFDRGYFLWVLRPLRKDRYTVRPSLQRVPKAHLKSYAQRFDRHRFGHSQGQCLPRVLDGEERRHPRIVRETLNDRLRNDSKLRHEPVTDSKNTGTKTVIAIGALLRELAPFQGLQNSICGGPVNIKSGGKALSGYPRTRT